MDDEETPQGRLATPNRVASNTNGGGTRQIRVLVVDDEPRVRDAIQNDCESADFSVVTASDGTVALAILLQDNDIDVVVTDFLMPNMSGWPLIKQIWEDERLATLPIIFMHVVMTYPEDNEYVREQNRRWGEGHNIHFIPKIGGREGLARKVVNLILQRIRFEPTHDPSAS